jgi:hypothetical protein
MSSATAGRARWRISSPIEFFTSGFEDVGAEKGGWSGTWSKKDFIPVTGAPSALGAVFPPEMISTIGGIQHESLFQIKWVDGDWWVGHNGHWLGYYPHKLWDAHPPNLIATQACEVDWYGEVADRTPGDWTWTDMGSGQFAEKGAGQASYFRDPSYVRVDAGGLWS